MKKVVLGIVSISIMAVFFECMHSEDTAALSFEKKSDTLQTEAPEKLSEKAQEVTRSVAKEDPQQQPQGEVPSPKTESEKPHEVTQKLKPQDTPAEHSSTAQSSTFDTLSYPEDQIGFRGNWVKKREWLLRAKDLNKKIQDISEACALTQKPFLSMFNEIKKELDAFYDEIAQKLGKMQTNIGLFEQDRRNEQAALSPAEQKVISALSSLEEFDQEAELRKFITEIDKELEPVKTLETALVNRIAKLNEVIATAHEQSKQANDLYEAIWNIIDDQKAQKNFFDLKNISRIVKSIQDYLNAEFAQDFATTLKAAKKQIEQCKEKIAHYEEIQKK